MTEDVTKDELLKARAELAAEKARAKAMRPWYRKKRFIIPAVLVVLVGVAAAAGGSDSTKVSATADAPTVTTEGVTSRLSTNDEHRPVDDVELTSCEIGDYGMATAKLSVINHSSKRSSYTVEITFERGTVKVGDGSAFLSNVEPGQTAEDEAIGSISGDSAGVTCRVVNVERFAA